ncbi:exodeoxyribonuclease III [Oxalobacter vibrioformis]|uniref:Exodeoxyribonuclease III n=1 Tax=Oxalobacter vibrioformis TaxID=933080 RepID=A0A9E9P2W4_9BURK|nr:exodeoxyribonuclease III [Oxalobacter vibrioformis]WAW09630.1 exodeoxyribonuclease III [Oxalobacter vibrioformis]
MKLVSWNVNGLRAALGKGFLDTVARLDADIICLQETKMQQGQAIIDLPDYEEYWNSAVTKGYSGTAIFTRKKPLAATYGIGMAEHDNEGRVITLEFGTFYLVNVYTPNSQQGLARLDYRMRWENEFRRYLQSLDREKPVILCGDLNVAHEEIDLKNPKSNRKNAGFTDEERAKMTELLAAGFTDTFRALHPDARDAYTWWSFRSNARANNVGWRIDYFVVSDRLMKDVTAATIHPDITGSDHCPVELHIRITP